MIDAPCLAREIYTTASGQHPLGILVKIPGGKMPRTERIKVAEMTPLALPALAFGEGSQIADVHVRRDP